nr:EamA family transporter [Bacteroidota bacterium]
MSSTIKAHIALFAASMIFGINYWVAKGLMPDHLSPQQLVFLRISGATLLFFAFSWITGTEKVATRDLMRIGIAGIFGTTVNQLLFFIGLNLTTPVDMAIIHVSNPIFVLIIAAIFINEKVSFLKVAGIILGATGAIVLIVYRGEISFSSNTFTGNLLALLNTLAYAIYLVIIKPVMAKYKPLTVMKWVFLAGLIFAIPFTFSSMMSVSFQSFGNNTWISMLYVIMATTFLAYLLVIYALKRVEASVASFYIYLQPVVATVIALWLGIQALTLSKFFAAMLIFTGVFLVSKKRNRDMLKQMPQR